MDLSKALTNSDYQELLKMTSSLKAQNKNLIELAKITAKQSGEISDLVGITKEQNKSNMRLSRLSLGISILAVILAGTSAIFSFLDWKGDAVWQKKQIGVFEEIHEAINPVSTKEPMMEEFK